eukprot:1472086-Pleurochrysis_carterae.AAC.1
MIFFWTRCTPASSSAAPRGFTPPSSPRHRVQLSPSAVSLPATYLTGDHHPFATETTSWGCRTCRHSTSANFSKRTSSSNAPSRCSKPDVTQEQSTCSSILQTEVIWRLRYSCMHATDPSGCFRVSLTFVHATRAHLSRFPSALWGRALRSTPR